MNTPQILTGQQAIDQYGLSALIECRVAVTTELNGLGHSVMVIGVIADPDCCQIDEDDTGVLWVEYQGDDDWYLYSIPADEQFVLLDDKNATPAGNDVLARRIAELTNELATANSMHLDNDRYKYEQRGFGCVDDLLLHFDALKAQVEQLKKGLLETTQLVSECFYDTAIDNAHKCLALTPAQCLAEFKARAIEDAIKSVEFRSEGKNCLPYCYSHSLHEYANQLRQQAKGSE